MTQTKAAQMLPVINHHTCLMLPGRPEIKTHEKKSDLSIWITDCLGFN